MNKPTAAQPLDLDKLEAQVQRAYMADARCVAFLSPGTILDLIAQARTARLVDAAQAVLPCEKWSKGSDSEENEDRDELACAGINIDTDDFPHQNAVEFYAQTLSAAQARRDAVLSAIQRAARLDTTASVSGEREGWEAAAKALSERAAGHSRNKNYTLQDECLQCASMLHDMKPGHTTLAQIAAQQAAAAPIKQYIGGRMVRFVVAPAGAKVTFGPDENTVHVEFAQQAAAEKLPIELQGIAEEVAEGSGFWQSCSGCYDTEDGHPTGPYSYSRVFGCALGSGCSECGGIGAVWDNTDYEAMAADMDNDLGAAKAPAAEEEEVLALHRQLAAEKLRADQGWERAEAKSKECIELRERMAERLALWRPAASPASTPEASQQSDADELLSEVCEAIGLRTDGSAALRAERIAHRFRELKACIKAHEAVASQQAAAVAAPSDEQANVLPPFAAPAGIGKDAWVEEISEIAELYGRLLAEKQRVHIAKGRDRGTEYYIADGIRWAIGELERRCRAQGGVTNSNSVEFGGINLSAVAATTSEDVRDAARLDWLEQNKATLTRKFDDSAYILAVEGRAIRTSTSAREAVDAAMRANQQEGE